MKLARRTLFVVISFLFLLTLILSACGTGGGSSTTTEAPPTSPPTNTPLPIPRSATLKTVEGVVEWRRGSEGEYAPAEAGQTLEVGDELRTGEDGRAVVALDDGTAMVVTANASFALTALEGTHESPVTQLFLNLGAIFTVGQGELADDASFEIETPNGVATIRGSMLWVKFVADAGMQVGCLIGHCAAEVGDQTVDLTAGKRVLVTTDTVGEVEDLDAQQKLEWVKALKSISDAGLDVSGSVDPACSCDGPDMKCSDGSVVSGFPTCIQGATCACDGANLVCGDQTAENSPICQSGATGCFCAGPNMVCDNNQVFYNIPACMGGIDCFCNGANLECTDGTVYPGDLACVPQTGCQCYDGFQICADGSTYFNTAACGSSSLPCVCSGTTFTCDYGDGAVYSIPDYPFCGGSGSGGVGGGTGATCACSAGVYVCSDGTVLYNDPRCAGGNTTGGTTTGGERVCSCAGPDLICTDGTYLPGDPSCASP